MLVGAHMCLPSVKLFALVINVGAAPVDANSWPAQQHAKRHYVKTLTTAGAVSVQQQTVVTHRDRLNSL